MARLLFDNRCKLVTSTKPNASTAFAGMNGSAPSGGYINPEAIHDPTTGVIIATGDMFPYYAYVDNLFECGMGTIDTSAHTLARAAVVFSNSSGTKARIDFSGASANPTIACSWDAIQAQSAYNLMRNQIYGLELQNVNTTTVGASAGCAFIEGVDGAPLLGAAPSNITPTLGASTHYNVYEFLSSGVPTLEAISGGAAGSTNPPVAFAVPAGTARSKTADTSRRYLGSVLTDSGSLIRAFQMRALSASLAEMLYMGDTTAAAPFKVLNAVTGTTTYQAIDLSAIIPNNGTAVEALVALSIGSVTTNAPTLNVFFSLNGTAFSGYAVNPSTLTSGAVFTMWVPINSTTTTGLYYKLGDADGFLTLICWGYRFRR